MRETVKKKLKVPRLTSLTARDAAIVLTSAGFPVPAIQFVESYEDPTTVVAQEPSRGQIVDNDTAVQLQVSRQSLILFLPSIYHRDDDDGSNVVRSLLWVIQHMLDSVEVKIESIHDYFDPYEAPEEFLPWLAGWVAFTLDENWPVEKKRRLIRRAVDFYRIRGTARGIKLFLKLFTGHEPEIIENQWPFDGFQIGVHSTIGVDSVVLPPVNLAHTFIVDYPVHPDDISDEMIIKIHDIIRAQRPAHTTYFLRFRGERRALSSFGIVIGEHVLGAGMEIAQAGVTEDKAYLTERGDQG